jgi:hypothetical protein
MSWVDFRILEFIGRLGLDPVDADVVYRMWMDASEFDARVLHRQDDPERVKPSLRDTWGR